MIVDNEYSQNYGTKSMKKIMIIIEKYNCFQLSTLTEDKSITPKEFINNVSQATNKINRLSFIVK